MFKERLEVKVLSKVLYEILNYRVSLDVAFKRACKGLCKLSLQEREELYLKTRSFISDFIKVKCVVGEKKSYGKYVRAWLKGVNTEGLPDWCYLSINEWFYLRLVGLLGRDETRSLVKAFEDRVWWLRINTLKNSEERILKSLENEGVEYVVDKEYPYLIKVIKSRKPIRLLKAVKNYELIPQDKASVAVVEALKPEPGDLILDMAFAPGIKTSLIMMLTDNKAKVVATDVSFRRALTGKHLLTKYGVDLSRLNIVAMDARDSQFSKAFDKVLLDAPCSNSGAVSKDPGLKITLTSSKVNHYSKTQKELLQKALKLGEVVVYSTCSLMPEEGEEVVETVGDVIKLKKVINWGATGYRNFKHAEYLTRLFPHKHNTEGFFIAYIIPKN
ncbi:MAG: hypothetical protein B7O98_03485 [Zestosphaera tikiterensis]|uniref:SAM-dependent MTase RsmB/NOP-type domain-containing protein n=1 Tax=Zestosphaera tikiterensis TaxID=1973259 RepID=A0A2R7Y9F3_9CREN|nr:MAG: hypothetical protein B7O98_03485 [Zestosphaera tikiterensis]